MVYLRLLKYPGAKFVVIPDIEKVFNNSHCSLFIDVFGGSGSVSLNINFPNTIYNDIDPQFTNLFNSIKYKPGILYEALKIAATSNGEKNYRLNPVRNPSNEIGITGRDEGRKTGRDGTGSSKPQVNAGLAPGHRDVIDPLKAGNTIVRFSRSFGGLGNTYGTQREKSSGMYLKKTLYNFGKIRDIVRNWRIENQDFRDIIRKYDSEEVFFYFDPPYPGKDWYNYNFTANDFLDLADFLKSMKGKYLLNLNADDTSLIGVFGKPSFIRKYANQNGPVPNRRDMMRSRSFYTNVHQ